MTDKDSDAVVRSRSVMVDEDGRITCNMPEVKGIITTCVESSKKKHKIVHYDFAKLVKLSAVFTVLIKGTVFNLDPAIHITVMSYAGIFAVAWAALFFYGDMETFQENSLPVILEISMDLQRFCPFVFGLFTSIMLSRWWAMRTDAVGAIGDHCINVSGILVSVAARVLKTEEDWAAFRQYHRSIVKWGLASMECIVLESRKSEEAGQEGRLEGLRELGLLNDFEIATLDPLSCHATCLWSWIQATSVEALEDMKVPPPNVNMLYQEVRHAMGGIHVAHNYLTTQLPFPYVHMITLLVNVNSVVIAVVAGAQCAIGLKDEYYFQVLCQTVKVFMLPVLYQALLQVCVFLSDPFGDDIIDFPIRQYQNDVSTACEDHLCLWSLYAYRRLNKISLPAKYNFMQELRRPPEAPAEKPAPPTPATTAQVEAASALGRCCKDLDSRLETLATNASNLTASINSLQETLTANNSVAAATAGNLQTQIKELSMSLAATNQLRLAAANAVPQQVSWSYQAQIQAGRPPDRGPMASCCAVDKAPGPEAIGPPILPPTGSRPMQ